MTAELGSETPLDAGLVGFAENAPCINQSIEPPNHFASRTEPGCNGAFGPERTRLGKLIQSARYPWWARPDPQDNRTGFGQCNYLSTCAQPCSAGPFSWLVCWRYSSLRCWVLSTRKPRMI